MRDTNRKTQKNNTEIYLIAENIRSLFNVGAIFRSADVFGVSKIYLCGYTACPPRKEISKTALRAEEWISWEQQKDTLALVKKLKKNGVYVIALETGDKAISLPLFEPRYPLACVVGNEVTGVSEAVLSEVNEIVKIPMLGQKESLNVAIAASIALYGLRY